MRTRSLAALAALSLALCASAAHAQAADIIGSWRGTSTCVDLEHWPACHNEVASYDVAATSGVQDTVTLQAYKVVNGVRDLMGESDFSPAADGSWVSDFGIGTNRSRIVLRITGSHMTGRFIDLGSGRTVREMVLDRVQ